MGNTEIRCQLCTSLKVSPVRSGQDFLFEDDGLDSYFLSLNEHQDKPDVTWTPGTRPEVLKTDLSSPQTLGPTRPSLRLLFHSGPYVSNFLGVESPVGPIPTIWSYERQVPVAQCPGGPESSRVIPSPPGLPPPGLSGDETSRSGNAHVRGHTHLDTRA